MQISSTFFAVTILCIIWFVKNTLTDIENFLTIFKSVCIIILDWTFLHLLVSYTGLLIILCKIVGKYKNSQTIKTYYTSWFFLGLLPQLQGENLKIISVVVRYKMIVRRRTNIFCVYHYGILINLRNLTAHLLQNNSIVASPIKIPKLRKKGRIVHVHDLVWSLTELLQICSFLCQLNLSR